MKNETEITSARELIVDEDVLSYSLRASLEQVGSATGFVLAFALLCALLPRAGRLLSASARAPRSASPEDRDVRAIERRAADIGEAKSPAPRDGACEASCAPRGALEGRALDAGQLDPVQLDPVQLERADGERHE